MQESKRVEGRYWWIDRIICNKSTQRIDELFAENEGVPRFYLAEAEEVYENARETERVNYTDAICLKLMTGIWDGEDYIEIETVQEYTNF